MQNHPNKLSKTNITRTISRNGDTIMDSKKFETELKQQPDTVNMDYVDDVINASLSNVTRNYPGLLNAIITMEECGELIQEVTLNENGKDNHYDLLQEMADVEICIYYLMKIFNISKEEFENQPESKHVTIAITKVCSKMIQEVSKAIRNKNNHYELLQSMVDTHHAIHQYMNAHNINEKALNKAINVKLNRLKKRGNNF